MIERTIVEAAARMRAAAEPYVLATAVCQTGSAYRRAGARLILAADRRVAGAISGGCIEGDLARRSWWLTRGAEPVVVTFDSTHPEDADDDELRAAFAIGCNGVIDVLLERSETYGSRVDPLAFAEQCARAQRRGGLATVYRSSGPNREIGSRLAMVRDQLVNVDGAFPSDPNLRVACAADLATTVASGSARCAVYKGPHGTHEVFLEALIPAPRLFVFGSGPDALPVVALARSLGWDASVCAPRSRPMLRERFALADALATGSPGDLAALVNAAERAVVVVMAHDYELDRAHLGALLRSRAIYIGVLGPWARTERMLADLSLTASDARVHAPIGLDLGAETPEEIALAITSEIQAVLAGVPYRSLRDRRGPIHERSESKARTLPAAHIERIACARTGA